MPLCVVKPKKPRLRKWPLRLQLQPLLKPLPKKQPPWQKRLPQQMHPSMHPSMQLKRQLKAPIQLRLKPLLPPWPRPNRPSLSWRCEAMTVLVKRKAKPPQVVMAATVAAMADRATGVRVLAQTVGQVAQASAVGTVLVTEVVVAKAVISAKTGVRAWAMPLSVPNVKPWSVPKCRCANWPHKPMAKR